MQSTDDSALLRQYAENNSEDAFAALVTRHVNLVYSVALRQTGEAALAEEITQAVFIILARKAGQLTGHAALTGWLFQATRLTAGNFVRSELRRRCREQEAHMQTILNEAGNEVWPKIAPLLDAAVAALREKDRQAILLRYYEGRNLREVGQVLRTSEDAAEKRVSRALEKLRKFFCKRGVDSTTTAIAETISTNSVQAAPVALAKTVTAVALAKGAAASASTLTLIKGALKVMAWTKAKTAIVAGVAAVLGIGTATIFVEALLPAPDIQGTWVGTVSLGGWGVHAGESPKTRLVLKITGANGTYQASGDDIDRGIKDVSMSNFSYRHRHIHGEIPASHDLYDGTVNLAGTVVSGIWKEGDASGPLVFKRTANPPPFPEPLADADSVPRAGSALQGFWKGVIKTGKTGLEVNIKIAEDTDGTFRADFYCPPQGGGRQPSTVSYDGTTIKLMPMAGYGMFQGGLRNGDKEMAGNWIQNGQRTPTTFTRAN